MNSTTKKLLLMLPLLGACTTQAVTPYIATRSQSLNAARDLAGLTDVINLDKDCVYGTVYGLFEYTRTFRPHDIANCLFGTDLIPDACSCDKGIKISGSQTNDRGATDWLADYFGLPTDFKSFVTFRPRVQNFIVDLGFYIGLDQWAKGLYFHASAPITHTKWALDYRETISAAGNNSYAAGYFSPNVETNLNKDFTTFANGDGELTFAQDFVVDGGVTTTYAGGYMTALNFAKMNSCPLIKTGCADLRATLGWNWACEDYHIGASVRVAAPTGLRPHGTFLFEPMIGNGHHWELGGGLSAHYTFWQCRDNENSFTFYFEGYATHLFRSCQKRTFDLKGKPMSRYMLAQKLGPIPAGQDPSLSQNIFPDVEFQNLLTPVANLTHMNVKVDVAVQGDVVAMLNFTRNHFSWDVGYNFWGRSCETIRQGNCPSPLADGTTWALKGDASVIGFEFNLAASPPVPLAATDSAATIHTGSNFPATGTTDPAVIATASTNPNINTPELAESNNALPVFNNPSTAPLQTHSSLKPVYLTVDDVNLAGTKGISHKIFTHLNYMWIDRDEWVPYVGIGAEVEFGSSSCGKSCNPAPTPCPSSSSDCKTSCKSSSSDCKTTCASSSSDNKCHPCSPCSLSQWGIWIKGGVTFN
ncbi:MAG: hypothetical protein NTX86_02435 [Candidatus Dependentiae bacterium]|nr:hypothetical protein [Candidatus Dependentiae bacterium]